jgi:hypothetical protein
LHERTASNEQHPIAATVHRVTADGKVISVTAMNAKVGP